jgi:hypothetical protein
MTPTEGQLEDEETLSLETCMSTGDGSDQVNLGEIVTSCQIGEDK